MTVSELALSGATDARDRATADSHASGRSRQPSIVFLARALNRGGAERQLVALASGFHRKGYRVTVALFYPEGALRDDLLRAGVRIVTLDKRHRWDLLGFTARLVRFLRRERPDVLHGYLAGPNILAALLKAMLKGTRVVWGVRSSDVDFSQYNWFTRANFELGRRLSRFADLIIVNSWCGAEYHQTKGYPEASMVVVPNGIDTERFQPDREAGREVRRAWGIDDDAILVGLVARFDVKKDHTTFMKAAQLLEREYPHVRFVCVGTGPATYAARLKALGNQIGLGDRLIWVGPRDDMVAVHNAFDIACSASAFGEGFSNVVGEAMACGVPCVATDVGDSARIVADTGVVVPARNPEALAGGFRSLLSELSPERREACRRSIAENYSVARLVERTEQLLWPER